MDLIIHLNIYILPMIILAIIYASMRSESIKTSGNRYFMNLLLMTFILLLSELASWLVDGKFFYGDRVVIWTVNIIFFGMAPLVTLFWLNYASFFMRGKPISSFSLTKRLLIWVPLAVYGMLLLSTPFTGLIFTVNQANHYDRGDLFYTAYIINFVHLVITLVIELSCVFDKKLLFRRRQNMLFAFYTALPLVAGIIQVVIPAVLIAYPCSALAEMLFYLGLQAINIDTDALTGVYNRRGFNRYLEDRVKRSGGFCLFMIDIDGFKNINDTFGHSVGDAALVRTAEVLNGFAGESGSFLARYGGDEFCLIHGCLSEEDAQRIVNAIGQAFQTLNISGEQKFNISCSVGHIIFGSGMTAEQLIGEADKRMYEIKRGRREDDHNHISAN